MKFIAEISSIDRWRSISIHFVLKRDSYPSYFLSVFGWLVWINSILDPPFLTSSSLDFLGNKHPRQCSTPRTQRERDASQSGIAWPPTRTRNTCNSYTGRALQGVLIDQSLAGGIWSPVPPHPRRELVLLNGAIFEAILLLHGFSNLNRRGLFWFFFRQQNI